MRGTAAFGSAPGAGPRSAVSRAPAPAHPRPHPAVDDPAASPAAPNAGRNSARIGTSTSAAQSTKTKRSRGYIVQRVGSTTLKRRLAYIPARAANEPLVVAVVEIERSVPDAGLRQGAAIARYSRRSLISRSDSPV